MPTSANTTYKTTKTTVATSRGCIRFIDAYIMKSVYYCNRFSLIQGSKRVNVVAAAITQSQWNRMVVSHLPGVYRNSG